MKILAHILVLFLLVNLYDLLYSQDIQPVRIEVPADIDAESFHVELLGKKGVLIFYESNEVTSDNQRKWFFGLFDQTLRQQWLKFIPLADKLEYVKGKLSDGKLYLLFRNASRGRSEEGAYEIVSYNLLSNAFSKVTGTFPSKAEIAGFEAMGNTGCLALNLRQDESDLLFIDLTTGDIKPVHILPDYESYIYEMYAEQNSQKIFIGIKVNKDNRYITDEILRFSVNGTKEKEYAIQIDQGTRFLNHYVIVPAKADRLKVIGIYDIITKRMTNFRDLQNANETRSAGMFYVQFDKDEQSAIKFYDFLNFNHLYGSAEGGVSNNIEPQTNNIKDNQKKLTSYFNLYDPQVLKTGNEYVFSAEAYQAYYTTETRMDYDFYGRPIPSTYKVFGGYDFYDVVVVGLSDNGEMIWNNDCPIKDLRTYKLDRQSIVFNDDEYISVAYVNDGKIFLKTFEGRIDIGNVETDIDTKYSRDRIAEDNFNHIEHWYDKYFLVYGYQTLKNRALDDKNNRSAFYVNKIAYR